MIFVLEQTKTDLKLLDRQNTHSTCILNFGMDKIMILSFGMDKIILIFGTDIIINITFWTNKTIKVQFWDNKNDDGRFCRQIWKIWGTQNKFFEGQKMI